MVSIFTSFVYFEWENLSFVQFAENLAMASKLKQSKTVPCAIYDDCLFKLVTHTRSVGYSILAYKFFDKYEKQIKKLFSDR